MKDEDPFSSPVDNTKVIIIVTLVVIVVGIALNYLL